ncbi:MAG: hypothetical protein QM733_20730 [Ilumatobacteraceae bacterium]
MFLIFGAKGRWSRYQHDTGEFFCPKCGGDRQWVRCVLRRWFSLFFVPIFPMGKPVVTAVQCTTCNTRFDEAALSQPTANVLTTELQGTMRIAATEVVRAAGPVTNAAAVDAVRQLGLAVYDEGSLAHDVATLDGTTLEPHLAYLGGALSLQGREQLLTTLVGVARSGGADALGMARPVLERIGQGLAMSPAHVAGVLAGTATAPVTPPAGPPTSGAPSTSGAPFAPPPPGAAPAPAADAGWAAPQPPDPPYRSDPPR